MEKKRKVGRPRKTEGEKVKGQMLMNVDVADAIRNIRDELCEETGFKITYAETVRYLIRCYEKQKAA